MERQDNVYQRLVVITGNYLGPAAERFIDRQIRGHLDKDPRTITKKDVALLLDWLRGSVSLLTDNERMVEEYIDQLRNLSTSGAKTSIER